MRRKWIKVLAAALCVVMAVPVIGSAAPLETGKACSLTVEPSGDSTLAEDLESAEIIYDLYKVAEMVDVGNYYTYKITSEFRALLTNEDLIRDYGKDGKLADENGLLVLRDEADKRGEQAETGNRSLMERNKEFWEDLAQEAVKIALDFDPARKNNDTGNPEEESNSNVAGKVVGTDKAGQNQLTPIAVGGNQGTGKTISLKKDGSALDTGLYLLIARGKDIEEYITTIPVETDRISEGGKKENIVTVAYTQQYVYSFAPQLISLPTKDADADGMVSTANNGDWKYEPTVYLKPAQSERYGYLEIVKDLLTYESFENPSEEAVFVFQIEAELNGRSVYSDMKTMKFTTAKEERVVIDKIPVGATVTVTEVYSGASYTLESVKWGSYEWGNRPENDGDIYGNNINESDKSVGNIIIYSNRVASVKFTNDYDRRQTGGHGIVNRFEFNEEEGRFAGNAVQIPTNSVQNNGNL